MPYKPRKGETISEYMEKCVKKMKSEGVPGEKARGICYAAYKSYKSEKQKRKRKKG